MTKVNTDVGPLYEIKEALVQFRERISHSIRGCISFLADKEQEALRNLGKMAEAIEDMPRSNRDEENEYKRALEKVKHAREELMRFLAIKKDFLQQFTELGVEEDAEGASASVSKLIASLEEYLGESFDQGTSYTFRR